MVPLSLQLTEDAGAGNGPAAGPSVLEVADGGSPGLGFGIRVPALSPVDHLRDHGGWLCPPGLHVLTWARTEASSPGGRGLGSPAPRHL